MPFTTPAIDLVTCEMKHHKNGNQNDSEQAFQSLKSSARNWF